MATPAEKIKNAFYGLADATTPEEIEAKDINKDTKLNITFEEDGVPKNFTETPSKFLGDEISDAILGPDNPTFNVDEKISIALSATITEVTLTGENQQVITVTNPQIVQVQDSEGYVKTPVSPLVPPVSDEVTIKIESASGKVTIGNANAGDKAKIYHLV